MAKITEKCPHCGNVVEGKIKRSTTSKVTRNVIKKGGMKTVLGIAGSVVPGFGNVAGFIAGTAIDAIWGDKINNAVDDAADMLVEDTNYLFTCPNCGHTWIHNESERIDYTASEEGDEEYDEFIESNKISMDILPYFIKDASICHYSLSIVNSQPDGDFDYTQMVTRVNNDTKVKIYDWQIKATTRQDVYEKLKEVLKCKSNDDLIFWHNIIAALPQDERQDIYRMEVYNSVYVKELGYALIGVNTSGVINVGDTIVLRTMDDEYYKAEVLWLEVFGKQLQSSESGDTLGMGIDIDLGTIPSGIDSVYKYDEIYDETGDEEDTPITARITSAEQEYINELKEILSDGEISPRERRLLDKIRTQLGIPEERAEELEASLATPPLTAEEQEYLDEYKGIILDGDISARDQRYLEKLKKANGISDERAKELELMASR